MEEEKAPQPRFIKDGMNDFERSVKRIGDCILALIALIVFSPLFLICYIAVKREDGGPAIFKQERIGRFGKPFNIYKFRSMRLDAEKLGPALYKGGKDHRLTKVGKFLREHHLDELPQLVNIFLGSMSVVGPRPPIPCEVEEYTPYQRHRLDVKGGLLCLWQIQKNRNALSFDEWVRLDLEYIQKQSLLLDLKIIFKGAYMVLFDRSGE